MTERRLFPGFRRRAATARLDEALDRGVVSSPESALAARLAAVRPALEQRAATPGLSESTRQAQRARLVAVATVRPATGTGAPVEPVPRRHRRRTAVALASALSLVGLGGVAVAASRSLPGDPFYDVKRGTESVSLALSSGDQSRGERYLELATTRLLEVRGLVEGREALDATYVPGDRADTSDTEARADRVARTLGAMDASTRSGTTLLTDLFRQGDQDVPLRTVELWAQSQTSTLDALLLQLGGAGRDRATVSLTLLQTVGAEAGELIATGPCPTGCDPGPGRPSPSPTPAEPSAVPSGTPSGPPD